jgi:phospholipid/cholesterol/gamma-HCH transport system substrate-binding protein
LIDSAEGALHATAARQQQLAQTIEQAPPALSQLRSSLVSLQRVAVPLGPAAQALQLTAPELTDVLRQLPSIRGVAMATLATAQRTAPDLSGIARSATPLIQALNPVSSTLARFATALDPVSATLDSGAPDILGTLEGWARAIQKRDGVSHVFRGELNLSPEIATSLIKEFVLGVPAGTRPSAPHHAAPTSKVTPPNAPSPTIPTKPRSPIGAIKSALPALGTTVSKTIGGGTSGLAALLGYLLKR